MTKACFAVVPIPVEVYGVALSSLKQKTEIMTDTVQSTVQLDSPAPGGIDFANTPIYMDNIWEKKIIGKVSDGIILETIFHWICWDETAAVIVERISVNGAIVADVVAYIFPTSWITDIVLNTNWLQIIK